MCDQYRKCVKCGVSAAQDPFITFHRFPKIGKGKPETILRSRIWAEYSFPNKNSADVNFLKKLHSSHKMICSRHFAEFAFSNSIKTRINKFAIPIDTEPLLHRLQNEAGPSNRVEIWSESRPSHFTQSAEYHKENEQSIILTENQINQSVNYGAPETDDALENISKFIRIKKPIHKHNILKLLGVHKVEELSTREKKLYNICRRSFQRISALKKKIKNKKNIDHINKIVHDDDVKTLNSNTI